MKIKQIKELEESAKEINKYIKENGELGFVEEVDEDTKAQYNKFSEYIKPDDISNEDANKQMKAEFASMFTSLKGRETDVRGGNYSETRVGDAVSEKDFTRQERFRSLQ